MRRMRSSSRHWKAPRLCSRDTLSTLRVWTMLWVAARRQQRNTATDPEGCVSLISNMRFTILLLPALFLLAACSGTGHAPVAPSSAAPAASAGAHVVTINNFKFQPAELTVKAGETVEWKNADIVPHSATANEVNQARAFDSGSIAKGGSWQWVANKPGTYDYICTLHPNMKGRVVV